MDRLKQDESGMAATLQIDETADTEAQTASGGINPVVVSQAILAAQGAGVPAGASYFNRVGHKSHGQKSTPSSSDAEEMFTVASELLEEFSEITIIVDGEPITIDSKDELLRYKGHISGARPSGMEYSPEMWEELQKQDLEDRVMLDGEMDGMLNAAVEDFSGVATTAQDGLDYAFGAPTPSSSIDETLTMMHGDMRQLETAAALTLLR